MSESIETGTPTGGGFYGQLFTIYGAFGWDNVDSQITVRIGQQTGAGASGFGAIGFDFSLWPPTFEPKVEAGGGGSTIIGLPGPTASVQYDFINDQTIVQVGSSVSTDFYEAGIFATYEGNVVAEMVESLIDNKLADLPLIPIGTVSSSRLSGDFGFVRLGYETNELDAIAEQLLIDRRLNSLNDRTPDLGAPVLNERDDDPNSGWPDDNELTGGGSFSSNDNSSSSSSEGSSSSSGGSLSGGWPDDNELSTGNAGGSSSSSSSSGGWPDDNELTTGNAGGSSSGGSSSSSSSGGWLDDNELTTGNAGGSKGKSGGNSWSDMWGDTVDLVMPIILDLDGDGIEIMMRNYSGITIDYDNDGYTEQSAWVGKDDGLLVIDLHGDGRITETREVALSEWSDTANTDLEGLRDAFDSNNDGVFDANDARFNEFRIWRDANSNAIVDEGELMTLAEAGFASIQLPSLDKTYENAQILPDGTVIFDYLYYSKTDGTIAAANDNAEYSAAA